MVNINVEAITPEQVILKDYLERNASDVLAEKVNLGVTIMRDGVSLYNKKDLATFMDYACTEAQSRAAKGARFACLTHTTVFDWLIHYFEEDSIVGKLYNGDGTEYKPPKPVYKPSNKPSAAASVVATPKPQAQASFFDSLGTAVESVETEHTAADEPEEFICDEPIAVAEPVTKPAPVEQRIFVVKAPPIETEVPAAKPASVTVEPKSQPTLRQLDDGKLIDEDGVVQESKGAAEVLPKAEGNPLSNVLQKLLSTAFIVR
ncbi:MAG: hypothetical protein FWH03_00960 [Firmicutes bacterium]|nr:hypothetical protein [Bacillota bacterium]